MTPQELGRALAEEMRRHAIVDRDIAKGHAQNAVDFQQQAETERERARHFTAMADGWEMTADKLESGVIDLGDARILAELRGGLADVQEALDPQPRYVGSVAVSATESVPVFGVDAERVRRANDEPDFWREEADAAAERRRGYWAEQVTEDARRTAAGVDEDGVPYEATEPIDPFGAYTDAQLDGNACISCDGDLTIVGVPARPAGDGPRGQLFVHSDAALCMERGVR